MWGPGINICKKFQELQQFDIYVKEWIKISRIYIKDCKIPQWMKGKCQVSNVNCPLSCLIWRIRPNKVCILI